MKKKNKEELRKEKNGGQTAPVETVQMPPELKAKLESMFNMRKDN